MTNQPDAHHSRPLDLSSGTMLLAVMFVFIAGPGVFVLQPIIVQGLVDQVGLTPSQANFVMFVEGMGKATTSVLLVFLFTRFNWHAMLYLALSVMVLGNLASLVIRQYEFFLIVRSMTGAAAGMIVPLSLASMGMTPKADRNFGIMWTALLTYSSIIFFLAPSIYGTLGINALFLFFSAWAGSATLLVRFFPTSAEKGDSESRVTNLALPIETQLTMAAVFVFTVGVFGIWANASLIGNAAGLSESDIAVGLSLSQWFAVAGCLLAAVIGSRFGRSVPIILGFLILGSSVVALLDFPTVIAFSLAIGLINFAWNFLDPFFLSTIAHLGPAGKAVIYGTSVRMIGVAVGPGIAGMLVADNRFDYVVYLCIGTLILSGSIVILALGLHRKSIRDAALIQCVPTAVKIV